MSEYNTNRGGTAFHNIIIILLVIVVGVFALSLFNTKQTLDGSGQQSRTFITFGTGGVTGVYYPTGGAISRVLNEKEGVYNIRATVASTGGSVFNINSVLTDNGLNFGIAQSDRQYEAYNGVAEWKDKGPQQELRSVFSIYPESVTLVAADNSGIRTVSDLRGKRVNLGNVGSGNLQNARTVLEAFGLTEDDVSAEYIKAAETPQLLQDERLDAFFYTVGHPNGNIKEATSGNRPARLVPIEGPGIDTLVAQNPFYSKTVIPVALYPQSANTDDVPTFGVKATLVTSSSMSDDIVYAVTKEVFENLDTFKGYHPAYGNITKESMFKGLSAPLHPGAVRYYEEAGLLQYADPDLIIR